jgi:hypothetical protein
MLVGWVIAEAESSKQWAAGLDIFAVLPGISGVSRYRGRAKDGSGPSVDAGGGEPHARAMDQDFATGDDGAGDACQTRRPCVLKKQPAATGRYHQQQL